MENQLRISRVAEACNSCYYEVEDDKNGALGVTIEQLNDKWTCLVSSEDNGTLHKSQLFSDSNLDEVKKYALNYCEENYENLLEDE